MSDHSSRLSLTELIQSAWEAHYRADWPEALLRWHRVSESFPNHPAGPVGVGRVLIEQGHLEEADYFVSRNEKCFPNDMHIQGMKAKLLTMRGSWTAALEILQELRQRHPGEKWLLDEIGKVKWNISLDQSDMEHQPRADITTASDPATCQLLMEFESLGDDCEFGLVQRHYEAEPLALLRWTAIGPNSLIKLLRGKFVNFGSDDSMILKRAPWGEYFLKESNYGITFHTWEDNIENEEKFLKKHVLRLRFLKDKLIDTLGEGRKIVVYKSHRNTMNLHEIEELHSAIRAYGQCRLLYVYAAERHKFSTHNGICVGHLSRHGNANKRWDIAYSEWVSLCKQTAAI